MNTAIATSTLKQGFLRSPSLIVLAFAVVFFPRIIDAAGAPAAINFVHFAVVPLVFCITLFRIRNKSQRATQVTQLLLVGLFVLFLMMTASAFLNGAGLPNLILGFLLLAEPFIFLLVIVYTPMTVDSIKWFRNWILIFGLVHVLLALTQHALIVAGILSVTDMTAADNVQGVFYLSGAGHVVAAAVSLTFGLYYFASAKATPIGIRGAAISAAVLQLLFADAKQVLLIFLVSWGILIVLKLTDPRVVIQYIIAAILVGYGLFWAIRNVPLLRAFNTWIRPGLYGPDGDATLLKLGGFSVITSFYETPLNWLFGLGPGHTVGRMGGWMIKEYAYLLMPFGATIHPASEAVWNVWRGSYLDSSFFSPLFGWIGIWGDFGLLGLGAYLLLWAIVWFYLCKDDFSKFCMITIFIFGFVFTQLEEPGYMLTITTLIGLRWHELNATKKSSRSKAYVRIRSS